MAEKTPEEKKAAEDKKAFEALEKRVKALEDAPAVVSEPKSVDEASEVEDSETFMYHKTKAPKGQKFKTSEIGKLGEGWVNTPAKFK